MDYTPAPDLFHDGFAHLPMITHPGFATVYQRLGQVALAARGDDRRRIERFYWFTVEFGLIRTPQGIRVYGNGILSSYAEIEHALGPDVLRLPFEPERIAAQEYDFTKMQSTLYVIESFEQLTDGFESWARRRGID